MQPFNWVDIDGIRYSWDGHGHITCTGQFGYQASIAGDRLDGVEIENAAGDVAGALSVDFSGRVITYVPMVDTESAQSVILVGDGMLQQEYPLIHFYSPQLQDLLGHSDTINWSVMDVEPESNNMPLVQQGQVLSWDSFHFADEELISSMVPAPGIAPNGHDPVSLITISLDLTNQVLDQLPPLHQV